MIRVLCMMREYRVRDSSMNMKQATELAGLGELERVMLPRETDMLNIWIASECANVMWTTMMRSLRSL